ncbi:MAG TPA: tetratricopeptide repeat protein, partial [Gemmataceae bacterium]|nr:tetratricopeptide repeat protein [Gemmataceae bacterium]
LAADPNQPDVCVHVARYHLSRFHLNERAGRDTTDDLALVEAALKSAPGWERYYLRASVRLRLKDDAGALADYNSALELGIPDRHLRERSETFHERSHCHDRLGDLPKALADIDAAIALRSNDAHFHAMRAGFQGRLGNDAEAVPSWRRSLAIKPDQPAALRDLAWIYLNGPDRLRDHREGLALAERAVALTAKPGAHALTVLGVAHYRSENYSRAIDALNRADAVRGGMATSTGQLFLAMCHHRLGQADRARACYDRALDLQKAQKKPTAAQAAQFKALRAEARTVLDSPAE